MEVSCIYKFKGQPKYTELLKNLDMDNNLSVRKEKRGESGDVNKIDQKREAERKKASRHVKCSCAMTLIMQCQHQQYVISALLFIKTPFPFKWRELFNCCFNDNNMTCNRHSLTIYFLLPLICISGRINKVKNKEIGTLGIKKVVVIHFHGRLTHEDLRLLSQFWMARKVVRNFDTPLVCVKRHWQTMKCAYSNEVLSSNAAYRGHTIRYYIHEGFTWARRCK